MLADAAHNLSDVGGLLLAWAAFGAAQLHPNMRHSYGWRKGSILASFVNAVILLVAMGTWSLFRRSLHLLFDGILEEIDLSEVQAALLELPGVVSVHDLHVWAISTRENAITAHLVLTESDLVHDRLLMLATDMLHERFDIHHTVLQPESETYAANCPTACGC